MRTEYTEEKQKYSSIPVEKITEKNQAPSISAEDGFDGIDDIDDDRYKLNPKQRWQVGGTFLAGFVLFSFLFFPYQAILRYYFFSFAKSHSLNFSQVDLSFFTYSLINNVNYSFGDEAGLETRQIKINIPLLSLAGSSSIDGTIEMAKVYYGTKSFSLSGENVILILDIENIKKRAIDWEGSLQIQASGVKLVNLALPALDNFGIDLSGLHIKKLEVKTFFDQAKMTFDGSQLVSNYFTLVLTGFVQLQENLQSSRVSGKLCLTPAKDLEEKEPNLMGAYILAGGDVGGELCMKMSGLLSSPDFEKIAGEPSFPIPEKNQEEGVSEKVLPKTEALPVDKNESKF